VPLGLVLVSQPARYDNIDERGSVGWNGVIWSSGQSESTSWGFVSQRADLYIH
jgi:hypothetical protein